MMKKKNKIFIYQMLRFGYLFEEAPECFNTDSFSAYYNVLLRTIDKPDPTIPVHLSIYKNDVSRRILSFPNPESYLYLVKTLSDKLELIEKNLRSENSQSPVFEDVEYSSFDNRAICSGKMAAFLKLKSKFLKSLFEKIKLALGYRYCLHIDISHFYDSIYSHSISWAIVGKENAKSMFSGERKKSEEYNEADVIDEVNGLINGKETNGILTGPYSSRIISEIILAEIDSILREQHFSFKRYVDDYYFYFKKQYEAERELPTIEKILGDYKLRVNESKIEIVKFPFYQNKDLFDLFENAYKKAKAIGVLQMANDLQLEGEKGAYKYALKFLQDKDYSSKNPEVILSILINILLVKPNCGLLVLDAIQNLKKSNDKLSLSILEKTINCELKDCLDNELEQEALLFSWLIKRIGVKISLENVEGRIKYFAPANYNEGTELDTLVKAIIDRTATNEVLESVYYICKEEYKAADKASNDEEIAKNDLIIELSNSRSFANTHQIVKKMSKFSKWAKDQKERICEIAKNNNQVALILQDEDIKNFYKRLLQKYDSETESALFVKDAIR